MKKLLNTLYIIQPNRYLSLDGENVIINDQHEVIGRVPLHNLDGIYGFGCNGVSPALMGKCASCSKPIVLFDRNGRFLCRCEGKVTGNVLLRREQYRVADDYVSSLEIAKNMITGKIFNSKYVLKRALRDHSDRLDTEKFKSKIEQLDNSLLMCKTIQSKQELLGVEGEAAQIYFSLMDDMILQQKDFFKFSSRNRRPPKDAVNALLSFTYSICTTMCANALEGVGLDPYVGFFHTDRPGRCSLALDLVEEFRSVLCDRFVISLINRKMINENHFEIKENGTYLLTDEGRKIFFTAWQNKKQEVITHPYLDEKVQWGMLPYVQALLLARLIRGDIDGYPVFLWRN